MGWSWQELDATPIYVKRYCWDLLQIRIAAQNAKLDKGKGGSHGG